MRKSWRSTQKTYLKRREARKHLSIWLPLVAFLVFSICFFVALSHHDPTLAGAPPAAHAETDLANSPDEVAAEAFVQETWTEEDAEDGVPIGEPSEVTLPEPEKETVEIEAPNDQTAAILAALKKPIKSDFSPLQVGDLPLTIDPELQSIAQVLFRNFNPPDAAAVVLDADTGAVLAMVSHSRFAKHGFLPTQPVFPAASVFKIVTSAAAIENDGAVPTTKLFTIGNPYRLNSRKFSDRSLRYARQVSLENALAHSNNVAFADLTRRFLSYDELHDSAVQFGWDRPLSGFELAVSESRTALPSGGGYPLAYASTGLAHNTLSPVHGALIAAAVVNEGIAYSPTFFSRGENDRKPVPEFISLPQTTAHLLEKMMQSTVNEGTARKSFRDRRRNPILRDSVLGGKTGSLDSKEMNGHCEWFIGYGKRGARKLALSVVMINRPRWHIKPAYVARKLFEEGLRTPAVLSAKR